MTPRCGAAAAWPRAAQVDVKNPLSVITPIAPEITVGYSGAAASNEAAQNASCVLSSHCLHKRRRLEAYRMRPTCARFVLQAR